MVEAAESAPETPGRKIVFVLGAGASAPFLTVGGEPLSTALIARALRSDELWRKVWRHIERERGVAGHSSPGAGDHLDINEALLLRDRVLSVLQATRFDHINFEHFIQLIDKTALYLCANHRTEIAQLDSLLLVLLVFHDPRSGDAWRRVPGVVARVLDEPDAVHAERAAEETDERVGVFRRDDPPAEEL